MIKVNADFLTRVLYLLLNKVFGKVILVHTPKCGGSYLHKQYNLLRNPYIKSVGHAHFRTLKYASRKKVVGLIRVPIDWYASYYYFCKKNLAEGPQSIGNFPIQHPVCVFSQNAELGLEQMICNMASQEFLENVVAEGITASVYARDIDDVFGFIMRTGTGFWSWTMMYHFSSRDTKEMTTKNDVVQEAKKISCYVDFIRQENIDFDVEKILNISQHKGDLVNSSPRPSNFEFTRESEDIVKTLDGEIAHILGGYPM